MGQPMKEQKRARGVHTAVVLPPDLLEHLRRSDRGVSEEVRRRVALTFEQDALDAVTRELCTGLVDIAARLQVDYGKEWHASPDAYRAFVAAVVQRLTQYLPTPRTGVGASDLLEPNDEPETIGRMRERDGRRERSYPHLEAAQKRRAGRHVASLGRAMRGKTENGDE